MYILIRTCGMHACTHAEPHVAVEPIHPHLHWAANCSTDRTGDA